MFDSLFHTDKNKLFITIAFAKKNSYFYKIKNEEITFLQNEKNCFYCFNRDGFFLF